MIKPRGLILVPYFGKLPSMFPLWVASASQCCRLRWLLITDCNIPCALPSNIAVVKSTFADVRRLIGEQLDVQIKLERAWDLCALRPAYGHVFQDFYRDYEFWGYGDLDVIYGDLDKFLTDDVFDCFDKICRWGHLSLIRNNAFGINAYRMRSQGSVLGYKEAFNGGVACFDERLFNDIIKDNGGRIYEGLPFSDFQQRSYLFRYHNMTVCDMISGRYEVQDRHIASNIFIHQGKSLWRKYLGEDGVVKEEEFAYIHFCRRKMDVKLPHGYVGDFWMVPNKFILPKKCLTAEEIFSLTKNRIYWSYIIPRLSVQKLANRILNIWRPKKPER